MNTRVIGNKGEDVAVKYLTKNKYRVIERNFNCKFGEIDVVANDGNYIVFVEVKSRSDETFGKPRDAVNWHKQNKIVQSASYWLYKNNCMGAPVRFDVIEVLSGEITHIIDAFRP